jgi:hypothetical protein
MAQNFKIIAPEYKGTNAPTNVLFGDTLKIEAGSTLALTSFSSEYDIRAEPILVKKQVIKMSFTAPGEVEKTILINVPEKLYDSTKGLLEDLEALINIELSVENDLRPNEIEDGDLKNNIFVGLGFQMTSSSELTPFPSEKISMKLDRFEIQPVTLDTLTGTLTEPILNTQSGKKSMLGNYIDPPNLRTLAKCGGVLVSFKLAFNQDPNTFGSFRCGLKKKGFEDAVDDAFYLELVTTDPGVEGDLPIPALFVNINSELFEIGDEFYNYRALYLQDPTQRLNVGPWSTQPESANNFFYFVQHKSKFILFYYDAFLDQVTRVWDQTEQVQLGGDFTWEFDKTYDIEMEYTPDRGSQHSVTDLGVSATLATSSNDVVVGTMKFELDFTEALPLMNVLGFSEIANFSSKGILQYNAPYDAELYKYKNLELALEIDAIKVKNFRGVPSDAEKKDQGRRNVVAYFTPDVVKSQHKYEYRYEPKEPIYLKVDTNNDIELSSLNFRIYSTLDNQPLSSQGLSFVLTNK